MDDIGAHGTVELSHTLGPILVERDILGPRRQPPRTPEGRCLLAAESSNDAAVEVLDLHPLFTVYTLGINLKILMSRDRRREWIEARTSEIMEERRERAIQGKRNLLPVPMLFTFSMLFLLGLASLVLWCCRSRWRTIVKRYEKRTVRAYRKHVRPQVPTYREREEERQAQQVIREFEEEIAALRARHDGQLKVLAYLRSVRDHGISYGEQLLAAEKQFDDVLTESNRQRQKYRWQLTNFSLLIAGAFSIGEIIWVLCLFFGLPFVGWFLKSGAAENKATFLFLVVNAILGAAIGLATTILLRIAGNHRRIGKVGKETRLDILKAQRVLVEKDLEARKQVWTEVCASHTALTGKHDPPPSAKAAYEAMILQQEDRLRVVESHIQPIEQGGPLAQIKTWFSGVGASGEDQAILGALDNL